MAGERVTVKQVLLALVIVTLLGLSAGVMSLLRSDAEREIHESVYGKKDKRTTQDKQAK